MKFELIDIPPGEYKGQPKEGYKRLEIFFPEFTLVTKIKSSEIYLLICPKEQGKGNLLLKKVSVPLGWDPILKEKVGFTLAWSFAEEYEDAESIYRACFSPVTEISN